MGVRTYRFSSLPSPKTRVPDLLEDYRRQLLDAVGEMPPLPAVLNQLLKILNDSDISSGQIATLVEKDNVLSGSVLRCVNSAYYGLPSRVSSIRHAVTLLGFGTVRNLALAFSMRRMLNRSKMPPPRLYSAYSQHALGCAIMTQFLAIYTRSDDADGAFAAGLFHDVGKLLIFSTLPEVVPDLIAYWQGNECDLQEAERAILRVTHSELSLAVLEYWKLPEAIQSAGRYHHAPDLNPYCSGQSPPTLAHLVQAADLFVNAYGLQTLVAAGRPPAPPDEVFEKLGLADRLPEIEQQFRSQFDSIREIFRA